LQVASLDARSAHTRPWAVSCAALRASGRPILGVEDPGYPGVRGQVQADGMRVVGVPVDAEGLAVEAIPPEAGAVLVTRAQQYPTGVVLSPQRRHELIAWARDTYVLEDDYDAEFRYDRTAVGTLQSLAPDWVVAMSSVSKTLAPALRLGWLTPPPAPTAELIAVRLAIGHGQGPIEQHALAGAIERGAYDRHVRRVRRIYRERRRAAPHPRPAAPRGRRARRRDPARRLRGCARAAPPRLHGLPGTGDRLRALATAAVPAAAHALATAL
jgi:GntR family transcriptional regulator/MocR family aminotransferase